MFGPVMERYVLCCQQISHAETHQDPVRWTVPLDSHRSSENFPLTFPGDRASRQCNNDPTCLLLVREGERDYEDASQLGKFRILSSMKSAVVLVVLDSQC